MSSAAASWRLELRIASETERSQAVIAEILAQLEAHSWESQDQFGIHLALEEALVNAIQHGNKSDPAKKVSILCEISREHYLVDIEDEGPGFKISEVPDPTDETHLDRPHGRGLLLMRSFMTSVDYLGRGNRVRMTKQRSSPAS